MNLILATMPLLKFREFYLQIRWKLMCQQTEQDVLTLSRWMKLLDIYIINRMLS